MDKTMMHSHITGEEFVLDFKISKNMCQDNISLD